jgi:MtN3 and saliva related transmembrane protein
VLGLSAGGLTTVAFIPQVLKLWRTKSGHDLSLAMLVVFAVGVALWVIYGLKLGEAPIVASNGITLFLALAMIAMKIKYG